MMTEGTAINVQPLTPEWTRDDFETEAPYRYLYDMRGQNKFMFLQLMNRVIKRAGELGINQTTFKAYWKAYVETVSPKTAIMGANETNFPHQPFAMQCASYVCDDSGVMRRGSMGEEIQVISHPLMPTRRIVDIETGEQKVQLDYFRPENQGDNQWKSLIVSRETIASSQSIISLSGKGLAITSENAREVVKYLSEVESLNYTAMNTSRAVDHMGWLNKTQFSPYAKGILFDGDNVEFDKIYRSLTSKGDENVWFDLARQVRSGASVPARIALAASFAAPLVEQLNALPFFVHLWGQQGSGKSVALMLGGSVWGEPSIGNYVKTFSGTNVSFEQFSAFCGSLPVFLDELQIQADRQSFDALIYTLCEGASKGRGSKNGGLQAQKHWSTCFITSGEMPIVKGNSGGGATVRVLEINYGGQPFFDDARQAATVLKENYGFAGPRFIEAITQPGVMQQIREIQQNYYNEFASKIQDKQVLSASVLLTADMIATKALFHDDRALTVADIQPYLVSKLEADINHRCYHWLMGYLTANIVRFEDATNNGEIWGRHEKGAFTIIKPIFDRILEQNGYSSKAFLMWAKKNNKLKSDNDRLTKRVTIGGNVTACVILTTDTEEEWQEDTDELPF